MEVCRTDANGPDEDVIFAMCVRKYISNETFIDTRDDTGAHRYHASSLKTLSHYPNVPRNKHSVDNYLIAHKMSMEHMEEAFGFPIVVKEAYISNSSVTFHRLSPFDIRRMEMLLYMNITEECSKEQDSKLK